MKIDFSRLTPMLQQYLKVKEEYPDSILFFRMGDFYEMFFEDALTASRELEIVLTARDAGQAEKVPMCGVPYHVANSYISRMIDKGYKVAICDQVEDPKLAKGLVKREVTRVVTPGTFTDTDYLDRGSNNFLLSINLAGISYKLAYVDYSTGQLFTTEGTFFTKRERGKRLVDEVNRINPKEILINEEYQEDSLLVDFFKSREGLLINTVNSYNVPDVNYLSSGIREYLLREGHENKAIIALLNYLLDTQKKSIGHINEVSYYNTNEYLILDDNTKRNLELLSSISTGKKRGSLLGTLDFTKTAMGSRLLKKWIESPLIDIKRITRRQDIIEEVMSSLIFKDEIGEHLKNIYDIERITTKLSTETLSPRDLISLKKSIFEIEKLKNLVLESKYPNLREYVCTFEDILFIAEEIQRVVVENPPAVIGDERIIREGYSREVDELFELRDRGQGFLFKLEEKEKERTNIPKLRIKYNKILGYFIEVTKSYIDRVPEDYIRKQTLVGSERYFTVELKDMESKIIGSKNQVYEIQIEILEGLRDLVKENLYTIQKVAHKVASLDCVVALADVAIEKNYVRPILNRDGIIDIKDGRHPIVEDLSRDYFVPNDTYLSRENMMDIITGPNMTGKSTYMRQVAIIAIMAHIGSYIPASYGNISILDRIFTRIGASDNLAQGDSTFMVEMKEVANIVDNATENSLLILDEVGRGTSTTDGLSIAFALVEYIVNNIGAKTLFATHYHELAVLESRFSQVRNLTFEVQTVDDDIVFLRKILPGYSSNSYGIDVAKLAGISQPIITRAREILSADTSNVKVPEESRVVVREKSELIEKISGIEINSISPLEALNLLDRIVKEAKNEGN